MGEAKRRKADIEAGKFKGQKFKLFQNIIRLGGKWKRRRSKAEIDAIIKSDGK